MQVQPVGPNPYMPIEHGTLWVIETGNGLPPAFEPDIAAAFRELGRDDLSALAAPADSPLKAAADRLRNGRRCFGLEIDGAIACYGWVTVGPEVVGELERTLNIPEKDAYVWDCGTIPEKRGKGLYSTLLSRIIRQLAAEDFPRIWIGASQLNRPSVKGIANAGFENVIDLIYRRYGPLATMVFSEPDHANPRLLAEAYRIVLKPDEFRWGRLTLGWKR